MVDSGKIDFIVYFLVKYQFEINSGVNDMYAVVEAGGSQIRVSAGDTVSVDKMSGDINTEIVMDKVLMISDEGKTVWGSPYVKGASIKAEIVGATRGAKILVLKTTPKKAHNKTRGHKQHYTTLKIKEIIGG